MFHGCFSFASDSGIVLLRTDRADSLGPRMPAADMWQDRRNHQNRRRCDFGAAEGIASLRERAYSDKVHNVMAFECRDSFDLVARQLLRSRLPGVNSSESQPNECYGEVESRPRAMESLVREGDDQGIVG